jgi:glutathione S-transferase
MKLYIGNKNYSSWSMRPWVLLKAFDIPFEEVKLRFDFTPGSSFYQALAEIAPVSTVPLLVEADGLVVWDSLAIVEYLAEQYPGHAIWPPERHARAWARSLCAEMHAGFHRLRQACPMNIDADLSAVGRDLLASNEGLQQDLARIEQLWNEALQNSGGPFLFGQFGAVDAYFAPMVMRISRYGLPLEGRAKAYLETVQNHAGVTAWVADAVAEKDFLDFEEPYRKTPADRNI